MTEFNSESTKILIVEDNEMNIKTMSLILKRKGYKLSVARNGQEGVDIYQKEHFDLILMDIQMPVMNGYEATKFIRALEKTTQRHIPIIALTAYAMNEDRQKCLNAGMDEYLSKPVRPHLLYATIENTINDNKT